MLPRTAKQLVTAVMMDVYPSNATCVDFGIDLGQQAAYEAYYRPIRKGEITEEQLAEAVCDGPKLTALLATAESNARQDIVINTMWDGMPPEEH